MSLGSSQEGQDGVTHTDESDGSSDVQMGYRSLRLVLYGTGLETDGKVHHFWIDQNSTYGTIHDELAQMYGNQTIVVLQASYGPKPYWAESSLDSKIEPLCRNLFAIALNKPGRYTVGVVRTALVDYPVPIFDSQNEPTISIVHAIVNAHPNLQNRIKSVDSYEGNTGMKDANYDYEHLQKSHSSTFPTVLFITLDDASFTFLENAPRSSIPPFLQAVFVQCEHLLQRGYNLEHPPLQAIHLCRAILHIIISLATALNSVFEDKAPSFETLLNNQDDTSDVLGVAPLIIHHLQGSLVTINDYFGDLQSKHMDHTLSRSKLKEVFVELCGDFPGAVAIRDSHSTFMEEGQLDEEGLHQGFGSSPIASSLNGSPTMNPTPLPSNVSFPVISYPETSLGSTRRLSMEPAPVVPNETSTLQVTFSGSEEYFTEEMKAGSKDHSGDIIAPTQPSTSDVGAVDVEIQLDSQPFEDDYEWNLDYSTLPGENTLLANQGVSASFVAPQGNGVRILSLDGGDGRCICQLIILQELMHRVEYDHGKPVRPCEYFNSITGVGASGVIAILLGVLGMTAENAIKAFAGICEKAFPPDGCSDVSRSERLTLAIQGILSELQIPSDARMAGDVDLGAGCCVSICYSSASTGGCRILRNHRLGPFSYNATIVEAARVSWATPGLFSSAFIGSSNQEELISAVNGFNNPALKAAQEVRDTFGKDKAISTFLSLGNGMGGPVSSDSDESSEKSAQRTDNVEGMIEHLLGISKIYFRFSPHHTTQSDDPAIGKLLEAVTSYTRAYVEQERTDRSIADFLRASASTRHISRDTDSRANNGGYSWDDFYSPLSPNTTPGLTSSSSKYGGSPVWATDSLSRYAAPNLDQTPTPVLSLDYDALIQTHIPALFSAFQYNPAATQAMHLVLSSITNGLVPDDALLNNFLTPERRGYRCSVAGCQHIFDSQNRAREHFRAEHLGAFYRCTYQGCLTRCKRVADLRAHEALHSPNTPRYRCDYCPESFPRKSSLNRHIEQVHGLTAPRRVRRGT